MNSSTALIYAENMLDELASLVFIYEKKIAWPDLNFKELINSGISNPGFTDKSLYSGYLGILLVFLYGL